MLKIYGPHLSFMLMSTKCQKFPKLAKICRDSSSQKKGSKTNKNSSIDFLFQFYSMCELRRIFSTNVQTRVRCAKFRRNSQFDFIIEISTQYFRDIFSHVELKWLFSERDS